MVPRARIGLLIGFLGLAIGCIVWWSGALQPAANRPDLWKTRPPAIALAGSDSCVECHAEAARTYQETAMARSTCIVDAGLAQQLGTRIELAPAFPFAYALTKTANGLEQTQWMHDRAGVVGKQTERLAWAIGSGAHARTFVVERPGTHFVEAPLTWYRSLQGWAMSPGYDRADHRRFNREISGDCAFCHFGRVDAMPGSRNRYASTKPVAESAISCERCHGAGERHLAFHSGATDSADRAAAALVNPATLPGNLANDVCLQCHRTGLKGHEVLRPGRSWSDFRPGMPLSEIVQQFSDGDAASNLQAGIHFTGKMAQLSRSRCFEASDGKLGCLTCHSIHRRPAAADRVAAYRKNCLDCHRDQGCKLPLPARLAQQRDDSCTACHMPAVAPADVPRTTVTDHRIRKPAAVAPTPAPIGWTPLTADWNTGISELEAKRNLGIAYGNRGAERGWREDFEWAVRLLEETQGAFGDDPQHRLAHGLALAMLGEPVKAIVPLRQAVRLDDGLEVAHNALANAARSAGDVKLTRRAAERSLAINPYKIDMLMLLASLDVAEGRHLQASKLYRRVLEVDAANADARLGLQYAERRLSK